MAQAESPSIFDLDRTLRSPSGLMRREIIPPDPQRSFRTLVHDFPSEICGWGAHPEYEIHLIQYSTGSFIAGDYVGSFGPGHLSIMGPMLPHDWVSDLEPGEYVRDRDVVLQFSDAWIQSCMDLMPELQRLEPMLKRSRRGLSFNGETAELGARYLLDIVQADGPRRVAMLLALLGLFADAPSDESQMLASQWLGAGQDDAANTAVEAGLTYIFDNLTGDIRLSTAAQLAYMSEPTFSKYFKRGSGMTFSSLVKRLRIAHARRLLDTTSMSVSSVAIASGYNNMANFNRQFLAEIGMTPSQYRRLDDELKPPTTTVSLGLKAPQE